MILGTKNHLRRDPGHFERIQSLRRMAYNSEDYSEGIQAVREHRKPRFNGQ